MQWHGIVQAVLMIEQSHAMFVIGGILWSRTDLISILQFPVLVILSILGLTIVVMKRRHK